MRGQPLRIEAFLEALATPSQLSPLLKGRYHPAPHAEQEYCLWRNMLIYPMSDGHREWSLTIPLGEQFEVEPQQIRERTTLCNRTPLFAEAHYITSALTLFDDCGRSHTRPALLQASSEPLYLFIRHHCSNKHRASLRRALESVAIAAEEIAREGLHHGSLGRHSVCFDHECRLRLTHYPISTGSSCDIIRLGEVALLLYIAASQIEAYKILSHRSRSKEEYARRLRCILVAAQHYSIRPMIKLSEHITHNSPAESIIAALKELAAEPFVALPLLEGLLWGDEHTVETHPYDIDGNEVVMVDFARCEQVLTAGEGFVRYRQNGLWGYAHTDGRRLPLQRVLLYADEFVAGRAVVKTRRGYGLMDTDGRMIMNDVWDDLDWHAEEGIATAADTLGKWRIYDHLGRQLSAEACDWLGGVAEGYVVGRKGDKFGYLATDGKRCCDFIYDEAYSFHNGLALVCFKGSRYHIDTTFHRLAAPEEKFIQRFRGLKTTP